MSTQGVRNILFIFRHEICQAFKSRGFLIAIFLGCAVTVTHFITAVFPFSLILDMFIDEAMQTPGYLFSQWIGGNFTRVHNQLYFNLLPIIAILPFGLSYFSDVKGGYIKNVCIRVKRSKYLNAKYIAAFLSGGAVVCIPLLINFYLSCLVLPIIKPEITTSTSLLMKTCLWSELYFSQPLLYNLLYMLAIFAFRGGIATTALAISDFVEYQLLALIIPVIAYLFIMSLCDIFGLIEWKFTLVFSPGIEATAWGRGAVQECNP